MHKGSRARPVAQAAFCPSVFAGPLPGSSQPPPTPAPSQPLPRLAEGQHRTEILPDSLNSGIPGMRRDPTHDSCFLSLASPFKVVCDIRQGRCTNDHTATEQKAKPSGKLFGCFHTHCTEGTRRIIFTVSNL